MTRHVIYYTLVHCIAWLEKNPTLFNRNPIENILFFSEFRILVMATLVLGSTPHAKLGSLTKALDATAVRGIEGSSVMKV